MARNRDLDLLKERALYHFEMLLDIWKIDYQKIGPYEYDFLSPTRSNDTQFGACRFNVRKGIGSDFAGISYSKKEYEQIGLGFTKEDFAGFSSYGESNPSFDIIGLCQRIHRLDTYSEASKRLIEYLDQIDGGKINVTELAERAASRYEQARLTKEKMRATAERIWGYCQDIKGTIGETYLNTRNIIPTSVEPNMKFHWRVFTSELKKHIPALIFKVSREPNSQLEAVHRIYLGPDGTRKARLEDNKKALGSIEGNGIWFGTPCDKLYICEGPEEALNARFVYDKQFVVSTVYAANYHNLDIPEYVKTVVLVPDDDGAGIDALVKADKAYRIQGKHVLVTREPPKKK